MHHTMHVHEEVAQALAEGRAVVALESTIISHGMPYPQNVETALRIEQAVRENGAQPATIAVVDGQLCVGLSKAQIETFGRTGTNMAKASRRDLPLLVAQGQSGATTVAATMIIAARAGISVFATGGIGGVHRNVTETLDISADLEELACTDVAVVCAGVKSILDIPRTLEYLETKGVPVIGYGTDDMPAFFVQTSGTALNARLDDPTAVAKLLASKWSLGLAGGVLITNPIPDQYAMDAAEMDLVIQQALERAEDEGIQGKDVTPYLLAAINRVTQGRSLAANIELVLNNARLAAQIATAYVNEAA